MLTIEENVDKREGDDIVLNQVHPYLSNLYGGTDTAHCLLCNLAVVWMLINPRNLAKSVTL